MSKKLLIVESPAKAKTIEKYLDNEFIVKASVGHIRDLPKNNKNAIDIKNGFKPSYEISKGKEHIVAELISITQDSERVVLATDPDREGEAIAWHVAEALGLKNPERIVFNEITKTAVQEALKHPRKIDEHLLRAQEARRVLDRLFGYDLSGLIWKKVRYGLSAGRVQSPALRIIMERERAIRGFVSEKFWVITASLKHGKDSILFTCKDEPKTEEKAKRICDVGKNGKWHVVDVSQTEMKRSPKPPFITSTLQQTASTRLGFAPSRTMGIAQKLYEEGHITYMRTDSTTLSKDAKKAIETQVEKSFGATYVFPREYKTKSKNAQEAHEAIRPTNISSQVAGTSEDQKKLYSLIWKRTIASQMTDANILRTKITANIDVSDKIPNFTANGNQIVFDGWFKADTESRGEEVELPKVTKKDELKLSEIKSEEKETQPLPRYTEAGIIKELEKRGIGRPSTYASTIKTLVDRGYVDREGRTLFPTDTGEVVSDFVETHFTKYISDSFTAEMENELDEIANGEREYAKTLEAFYKPFLKEVKSKESMDKLTNLGDADEKHICPKCGKKMVIKLSKNGKFLSCSNFPECTGARKFDGTEMEGPKETGKMCPECGKPLVARDGKFGRFVACSNYPKCKYVQKENDDGSVVGGTGIKCPLCQKGEMAERKGRFGIFYGCSNYPACRNAIKARPTGEKCKLCDSLMMQGTKTIPERCSDKSCPNHNPHKFSK